MRKTLSTGSSSSSFYVETPNFFKSISNSSSFQLSKITDSAEHNLWMESQLKTCALSSPLRDDHTGSINKAKVLEGVKAFVDVRLKKTSVLRQMLRDLGAHVNLRFSRNITHLIFWNGRQETLDKAHHLGTKISIISPHWVFKCFVNLTRADEGPFLLYGIKDLAIPMRLMAMGRVGTVSMSFHDKAVNSSGDTPSQSQIVHAIETLSDQLTSKLSALNALLLHISKIIESSLFKRCVIAQCTLIILLASPTNNENIDVVEIISPIVDRVRKRLDELNMLNCYSPMETPFRSCACNVDDEKDVSCLSLKHSENGVSTEVNSIEIVRQQKAKDHCRVSKKQRRHTISRTSVLRGESDQQFATPTAESSTSVNLVEITQSELVKRRGRPTVNSEQLAEYTPVRFHKYLQRRYRSIRAGHAAQLNTEKMVCMYRKMMDRNFSKTLSDSRKFLAKDLEKNISKARPVVVRTRSSVLNELQNVPSSNEFVKKKKTVRKRVKSGNIILSGITKIERETVFAITKKLGVLKIASTVDERTRYVVSDQEGVRTVNVMRALVKGIPIVTIEWAYRSLEIGGWLKGSDFFVSRWKIAHRAWLNGRMARLFSALGPFYVSSKCEPEAKHLLHLIKSCHGKTTESLNRAVIFVAPHSEWGTFMQLRKDNETRATYITEKSLLGTVNNLLTLSELYEGRIFGKALSLSIQYASAESIFCCD
uniref:BRCT domain-containing protein n=1 Tax=Elaeophora elaphi TaxID=1147741 RepID=A0A158Q6X6_9BILA